MGNKSLQIEKDKVVSHIKKFKFQYIIILLLVITNIQIFADLVSDWMHDDNYSHGFFIIPISVYLFFKKRNELVFPSQKSTGGLFLFIVGLIMIILGTAASEFFTTRVGFVAALSGFALYTIGCQNFKKVWFPFFFLLFMIPIPSIIYYAATLPMQLLATKVTVGLLQVIGVPVARNGNIIALPNYSLEVVEACSGLRSLMTLLALGALYSYTRMPGKVLPIVLFLATIPIAIATNIFRIFITALGAYAISKELAENFLHELSGMLVFITALIMMLILGAILRWIRNRFISHS